MTIYYKQQITQVHYVYKGVIWIRMSNWQGRVNLCFFFYAKCVIFNYIMGRISQLLFWCNYDICFMLDQHAECDFILILLWHNSLQVDMLFHCDTLPWLRANQSTYEWCVISSKLQMYSLWFDRTEHWVQDLPHSRRVDKIVKVEIFCSTTTVFSEVFRCHPPLKHTSKI